MIHNHSDISSQGHNSYNTYQIDGQVIPPNDSDLYLLVKKTTGVKNSGENKVNHGTGNCSVKTGLVKSLLIGAAVLTGIGALATCGYYYVAGRQSSGLSENSLPSRLSVPVMANIIPWETGTGSRLSMTPDDIQMAITDSSLITETTSSPYSYYEGIYGSTASLNNNPSSLPVTTIAKPVTTTTEKPTITTEKTSLMTTGNPTSVYMIAKPTTTSSPDEAKTEYKHDSAEYFYYQSVKGNYNYPLGTKFFNELLAFCLAETKYDIEQAYRGTPELRCKLLDDINNKIEVIKENEALFRRVNAEKETLSVKEYGEKIMLRRKLATLYLAAEAIINKKDFDVFFREVNRDYKRYSTKELKQREEKIMNYFPEEC